MRPLIPPPSTPRHSLLPQRPLDPESPQDSIVAFTPAAPCHCRGSALLLVIGATAALGTLAALLLSVSLLAYEGAVLRADGAQARLLAAAGLLEVERELQLGHLLVPAAGIVWQGALPDPPPGIDALSAAAKPQLLGAYGGGCGFQVSLSRVRGPSGDDRWIDLAGMPGPAILVDALADGWCGRGAAGIEARFAVVPAITGTRLY